MKSDTIVRTGGNARKIGSFEVKPVAKLMAGAKRAIDYYDFECQAIFVKSCTALNTAQHRA